MRSALLDLVDWGLIDLPDRSLPRALWSLVVPGPIWDVLAGLTPRSAGMELIPPTELLRLDSYLASPALAATARQLPVRVAAHARTLLLLRGPRANGRGTLAGAVARALGYGLLHVGAETPLDGDAWRLAGVIAQMTGAMPLLTLDLSPGEERMLPDAGLWQGPVAAAIGPSGALTPASVRPVVMVDLPRPDPPTRRAHWRAALSGVDDASVDTIADGFRLTGGVIRRAASALPDRPKPADVRLALRPAAAPRLETIAERLEAPRTPLILDGETRHAFDLLLVRCRQCQATCRK